MILPRLIMGCNDNSLLLYLPLHTHVYVNEHQELKAFFSQDLCNSIQKSGYNFSYPVRGFTLFCQSFQVNVLKQTITNSFLALAMQDHTLTYLMLH